MDQETKDILNKLSTKKVRTKFVNHSGPHIPADGEPFLYYPGLTQIDLKSSLRKDLVIVEYKDHGVEGLFSEVKKMLGEDNRSIKSNPFYWTETKQPTFKQKFIRFIKDPFGIKARRFLKHLQNLKPGLYEDHIDRWH